MLYCIGTFRLALAPLAGVRNFNGGALPLEIHSRRVGDITVVTCKGRIVLGGEATALHEHVNGLLGYTRDIVLNLGDVDFIDSSGMGVLVRLLGRTQAARGDLKLCNLTSNVASILAITRINTLFDTHPSEQEAIAAFFRRAKAADAADRSDAKILCVDKSGDVLAYLRGLLQQAGYSPTTTASLPDALILLRVAKPKLLIVSADLRSANTSTAEAIRKIAETIPIIELRGDFSQCDAGEAGRELLEQVRGHLQDGDGALTPPTAT
jgi:anti-sigma B factor antagonist